MKISLMFTLTLCILSSCKGDTQPIASKKKYNFPNTSVITTIPVDCMDKEENQLINTASNLESLLLNIVGDEVTQKEEISFGKKINDIIKKDNPFINDERLVKLQQILNKLTPHIQRSDIKYTISLIKNDLEINAWTHAGGYIYVTTGLINFVQSEDELAFCIAHEIGHNENKHCMAAVQRIKTAENMGATPDLAGMAYTIYSSIFAAFNQPQEIESDLAGLYLVYKAGYDPERALDFFEKLSIQEQPNALEKMLRSHPFALERSSCLKDYLNNAVQ